MSRQRVLTLLATLLVCAQLGWAQTTNQGAIVGTATDPQGAALAGVGVTAVNTETGVSRTVTTNGQGNYRLDFLPPGKYQISAEQQGFKKVAVPDLTVQVGQVLRVDLKMEVGAIAEEVTIASEDVPPINTESPALGEVIDSQKIQNLPLNGREFLQLAATVPGAESGNQKRGVVASRGVAVGFNGARSGYNSYYVDGAQSTDPLDNQLVSSPALDAIKEFRVETNMYSAQYGRSGGAIISIVTNSGSNQYHGTLYEYHRNKALDASPYFDKRPREQQSPYLFNQFGGTVGGPIIKGKTFFFFSMEKFRQKKPGALMVTWAPTAKERAGDFSESINPWSLKPVVLRNPFTGEVIPGNKVPANLVNAAGKKLLDLWPEPNYSGDPFLNLRMFRSGTYNQDKYLVRVDHHFSEKDSVYGTFDFNDYDNIVPYHTIYGDKNNLDHNRTVSGTYTHTFAPTLVNDVKFSYTNFFSGSAFALRDKSYGQEFGLFPGTNKNLGSPRLLMYTYAYNVFGIGNSGDFVHQNYTYYLKDNLVWVKGKHTFLMGGDYMRQNYNWQADSGNSQLYFGLLDGLPGYEQIYGMAGHTVADLLMGVYNLSYFGLGEGQYMKYRRNVFSAFLQDDWKLSPRLTLNLGVRYDYEAPFSNANNEFATLNFETGMIRYAEGAPADKLAILKFPYETGGPNRPFEPNKLNWSPRFGFAFRPFNDTSTALRGGYGLYYTSETAYNSTYGSWVSPFNGIVSSYPGYAASWADRKKHITTLDQEPYGLAEVTGKSPGPYFIPNSPYYPTGYLQQWNLSLARELYKNLALEVAYVGSKGTNLNGPSTVFSYSPDLNAKVTKNIGLGLGLRAKGYNSKYHSMQVKVTKRFSQGLHFLGAYTWGHAMAEASNDSSNESLITDYDASGALIKKVYTNADFDVRHRFSLSGGYELPFGRGKRYSFNTSDGFFNSVFNEVFGGWQLTYIVTFQSGYPFTVYMSNLRLPDRVCDGSLPKDQRSVDRWIDISCFPNHPSSVVKLPDGTSRTISLNGNAAPNIIRGPGLNNFDLGLLKNFKIAEGKTLQFRTEFFNAFNHPNLVGPNANYFINSQSGAKILRVREMRDIQFALKFLF